MNVSSSKMEATAAASLEKSESAVEMEATADLETVEIVTSDPEMETTAEIETAADMESTTEMETTIDVVCTRDMVPAPLIPNTATVSRQKRRPNTPVSIDSVRHDHRYENSLESLKIQLASARKTIRKFEEERKSNQKRIKRLTTKISSLKDIVRTLWKNTSVSQDSHA